MAEDTAAETAAAKVMESNKSPRHMKATQQAHQDGRNGQSKAGPLEEKKKVPPGSIFLDPWI